MQFKEFAFKTFWYLFPLIVLFAAQFLIDSFPKLQQLKVKNVDLATIFLVIGLHELSIHTFQRSVFPFWLITAMFLAIGAGIFLAYKERKLDFKKVFKIFWRLTFLMTIALYFVFILLSLFM